MCAPALLNTTVSSFVVLLKFARTNFFSIQACWGAVFLLPLQLWHFVGDTDSPTSSYSLFYQQFEVQSCSCNSTCFRWSIFQHNLNFSLFSWAQVTPFTHFHWQWMNGFYKTTKNTSNVARITVSTIWCFYRALITDFATQNYLYNLQTAAVNKRKCTGIPHLALLIGSRRTER
jgi:hypothetical protein